MSFDKLPLQLIELIVIGQCREKSKVIDAEKNGQRQWLTVNKNFTINSICFRLIWFS